MPLLLFIIVPLIELYFIIKVGGAIGAFWTVLLVIMTAVIGLNLLRVQGMSTLIRAQRNMAQGQVPAMEMMEGIALAVAGVLLIIPGFITDSIGFLCLIPASRRAIIRFLMARGTAVARFDAQSTSWQAGHHRQHDVTPKASDSKPTKKVGRTIEGEYRRED